MDSSGTVGVEIWICVIGSVVSIVTVGSVIGPVGGSNLLGACIIVMRSSTEFAV